MRKVYYALTILPFPALPLPIRSLPLPIRCLGRCLFEGRGGALKRAEKYSPNTSHFDTHTITQESMPQTACQWIAPAATGALYPTCSALVSFTWCLTSSRAPLDQLACAHLICFVCRSLLLAPHVCVLFLMSLLICLHCATSCTWGCSFVFLHFIWGGGILS